MFQCAYCKNAPRYEWEHQDVSEIPLEAICGKEALEKQVWGLSRVSEEEDGANGASPAAGEDF